MSADRFGNFGLRLAGVPGDLRLGPIPLLNRLRSGAGLDPRSGLSAVREISLLNELRSCHGGDLIHGLVSLWENEQTELPLDQWCGFDGFDTRGIHLSWAANTVIVDPIVLTSPQFILVRTI